MWCLCWESNVLLDQSVEKYDVKYDDEKYDDEKYDLKKRCLTHKGQHKDSF